MTDIDRPVPFSESLPEEVEYKKSNNHLHYLPHHQRKNKNNISDTENKKMKKVNKVRVKNKETETSRYKRSTDAVAKQCRRLDSGAAFSWHSGDESDRTIKSKNSGNKSHKREDDKNLSYSSVSSKAMQNSVNNSTHTVSSHRQASEFSTSDNDAHQHSYDQLTIAKSKKKETNNTKKKKKKMMMKKAMKRKAGSKNKDTDKNCDETNAITANHTKGKENNRLSETERLRLRYMQSLKHTQNIMEEGQQQGMNNVQDSELRGEYSDKTAFLCVSDAALHVETERKWFDMPYEEYIQEMLSASSLASSATIAVEQISTKHNIDKGNSNSTNAFTSEKKVYSETKRSNDQSGRNNVHYNVFGSKNIKLNLAEVRVSEHGFSVGVPFQYETNYYNYIAHKNCNVNTSKCRSNNVQTSSDDDMYREYTYNGNCSRAHTLLVDGWLTNTHYPCLVREFAITHDMLQTALQRILPFLTHAMNDVLGFNIHVNWNKILYTKTNSSDKKAKSVLEVDDAFLELLFCYLREYLPIVEYQKVMKQTTRQINTNTKAKAKSKKNEREHQHEARKQSQIIDNSDDDGDDNDTNDVVIESTGDHTQVKLHETCEKEMLEELTLESENDQCEWNESRVAHELTYDTLHLEGSLSAPLSLETTEFMPITTHVYLDNSNNKSSNINKSKASNNWHERSSSSAAQWWNNLYEQANDKETATTASSTEQLWQQSHTENNFFWHEQDKEECSDTPEEEKEEEHNLCQKQKTDKDLKNDESLAKMKHAMHVRWQSNGSPYQHTSLHNDDSNKTEIMQMPILALHVMRAPEEQIVRDECTETVQNTEDGQNVSNFKNNAVNNHETPKKSKSKILNSTLYKHKNAIATRYETITRVLAKNDDSKNRKTKESSSSNNNNVICDDNNNNFCIIIALALPLIWQGSVSELMHCVHECHVDYWTRENILRRWVKSLLPQLAKRHECRWFHGNLSTENWFDAANITCAMYDILSELNKKEESAEELREANITERQEMHESENEHEKNNISSGINKSNTKSADKEEFTSHQERKGKYNNNQWQTEWDNTHHANSHVTSTFNSSASKMSKYVGINNNVGSQNASMSASHIIHSPLEHIRRHFSLSFSHDEKQCDEIPLESFSSSSSTSSNSSYSETAEEPLSHVKSHKQKRTNRIHVKKTLVHTTNNAAIDAVIHGNQEEEEQGVNEIPCQSGICIADDYYEIVELAIAMTLAERVLSNVLSKINIKEQFHQQSYQTKEKLTEQQLWMTAVANNNSTNRTNSNCSRMWTSPSLLQTIVNKFVHQTVLENNLKEKKNSGSRELHMFTLEKSENIPAPECIRPEFADKHVKKITNHFSSDNTTDDNKNCKSEEKQKKVKDNALPFRESKNNLFPYSLLSASVDVWQFGVSLLKLASVSGDLPSWCYYEHNPILSLEYLQAEYGEFLQRSNWKVSDGTANVKETWSSEFAAFVDRCLETDPLLRPSFAELLNNPWLQQSFRININENKKEEEKEENTIIDNYKNEHERNKNSANNESSIENDKKTNVHTTNDIKNVKSKCHDASFTKLTEEKEYYKAWWQNNVKNSTASTKWNSCKRENLCQNKENNALNLIRNTSRDVNTYSRSVIDDDDDDDDNMSRKIMTYIISRKTSKVSSLSSLPSLLLPLCTKGGELVAFHYNIKQCCSAMVHGNGHVLRPNYTRLRELYVALVGQDRVDVNLLMCNNCSFQLSRNLMQRQRSLVNSTNYGSLTTAAVPAATFALSATSTTNHVITANNMDKNYLAKEKSMRKEQQQRERNNERYNQRISAEHKCLYIDNNENNLLQKSRKHNIKILPNASECNVSNFTNSYCSNSYRPLQHSWSRSINKSFKTSEAQPFHSTSSVCITSQLMLSILLDRYGVHVEHEPSLSNSDQITQHSEKKTNLCGNQVTHETTTTTTNNNSSIYQSASHSKSLENNLEQTKAFYDLNEVNVLISAEEQESTEITSSTPAATISKAETNFANTNSMQTKTKKELESVHETLSESNESKSCEEKNLSEEKEEGEVNEEDSVQGLTNAHHSPFLSIMSATLFDCERALRGAMKNGSSNKSINIDDNFYDDDDDDDEEIDDDDENDNPRKENKESEKISRLRDGIFAIMQSFWALHEQAPIAADIWGVLLLHALSDNTATLELLEPLFDTLHLLPIQQNNDAEKNMHNENEKVSAINSASNSVSGSMENSPATALQKRQVSLIDNNKTSQTTILTDDKAQTLHKNDSKNIGSSCLIKTLENQKIHNGQFVSHTQNYKTSNRGNNDNNKEKRVKTMVNLIDPSLFHCYQSCKWYNASSILLDAADHSR